MYVICDKSNIVRHYSEDIRYITTQPNGVTVGTTPRQAEAVYCNTTDTYWPIKETYVGQPTYTMYQVEEIPESCGVDITRYHNGVLESAFETADAARSYKLPEISTACERTILAGAAVTLSTGEKQFSYTEKDQLNISEMFSAVLMGATSYPYHEDGGLCEMFTAADIVAIYTTLSMLKTSQLTYHNQLKHYMESLDTPEAVLAVTYGQELTGEYLDSYNTIVAQTQAQLEAILAKLGGGEQ